MYFDFKLFHEKRMKFKRILNESTDEGNCNNNNNNDNFKQKKRIYS